MSASHLRAVDTAPVVLGVTDRTSDAGNARRFAAQNAGRLIYVPGIGWHLYNERYWARDTTGGVMRAAKATARAIVEEAAGTVGDTRNDLLRWALRSESEPRLRAMVTLAESELELVRMPAELDADQFLLNVRNGTLDLRSRQLRPHDASDLITKCADVDFRADAEDAVLERFLWGIFEDRPAQAPELLTYLARAIGYCLTGDTREERLFFLNGPTATGKSTLLGALRTMLGDYAATADFETFIARRGDAGVRNDIARLAGARMVISLEVDEGKKLAEGVVKALTGGDTITARFLYKEAFEFRPAFKLLLAANARPRVSASDAAMWRRIDLVPFTNEVPEGERDPKIKEHLLNDPNARSALLAWAVEGCALWQEHGLGTPDAVKAFTADYRLENDRIAEWLADACELEENASAASSDLHQSYAGLAEARRERPLSARAFAAALREHGLTSKHGRTGTVWHGLRLRERDR